MLSAYALHHFEGDRNAGFIITLQDVWTLTSENLREMHLASWTPIDHNPAPPAVVGYFKRTGAVPIAMSRFGVEAMQYQDLEPLYVPHGVDTEVFKPRKDRAAIRGLLGLPEDAFVVGMVAANMGDAPSRKAFPEVFQAFARFRKTHPTAKLYLHTRMKVRGGLDLPYLASNFGLEEDIIWVDQGALWLGEIQPDQMAAIYSMMDVLVNPSYGEGFGIPIIEAQACGTPVIVADNTAQPELLGGGWLVECDAAWDEFQKSFWGRPRVDAIESALNQAYHANSSYAKHAREKALEYDADLVTAKFWKPALDSLEQMLGERDAVPVDLGALRIEIEENGNGDGAGMGAAAKLAEAPK